MLSHVGLTLSSGAWHPLPLRLDTETLQLRDAEGGHRNRASGFAAARDMAGMLGLICYLPEEDGCGTARRGQYMFLLQARDNPDINEGVRMCWVLADDYLFSKNVSYLAEIPEARLAKMSQMRAAEYTSFRFEKEFERISGVLNQMDGEMLEEYLTANKRDFPWAGGVISNVMLCSDMDDHGNHSNLVQFVFSDGSPLGLDGTSLAVEPGMTPLVQYAPEHYIAEGGRA